jgi:hypothetical protein
MRITDVEAMKTVIATGAAAKAISQAGQADVRANIPEAIWPMKIISEAERHMAAAA